MIRRQMVWDYLLANPCVDCQETNPIVLQFDHVTGKKTAKISTLVNRNISIEKLKLEISQCEVRCSNCHAYKTASEWNHYQGIVRTGIDPGWKSLEEKSSPELDSGPN